MHDVSELPLVPNPQTRLWVSDKALKEINSFCKKRDPNKLFLKRMKRYCENGFGLYEGGEGAAIRHERGVYRIRPTDSKFRIIGFYDGEDRGNFIALDAFLKLGQKLTSAQEDRIDAVGKAQRDHAWRRKQSANHP